MSKSKPIFCVELNKIFNSSLHAERELDIVGDNILLCCRGKRFTAGGYHWCYADDKDTYVMKSADRKQQAINASRIAAEILSKPVYCFETGESYPGIKSAGEATGDNYQVVGNCCRKKTSKSSSTGYHYCFLEDKDTYSAKTAKNPFRDVYCIELDMSFPQILKAAEYTKDTVSVISKCCRKQTKKSSQTGYHYCYAEEKEDWKKKKQGGGKEVYCFELDRAFNNAMQAEKETGINDSHIGSCCKKEKITAGGYHWCYLGEEETYIFKENPRWHKIYCFELDKVFDSISQAEKETGIDHNGIRLCCKSERVTAGSYHWCYLEDKDSYLIKSFNWTRKVYCFELDKVFDSISQAEKETDTHSILIVKCCKGQGITANGNHWCYLEDKDTYEIKQNENKIPVYCYELNREYESAAAAAQAHGLALGCSVLACCNSYKNTAAGHHWCYANEKDTIDWEERLNHKSGSIPQKGIANILKKNNYTVLENIRTLLDGQEIDIYLPEHKIGIEYNGNYWHNERTKGENYHQEKALACKKAGIKLISIFSHQWGDMLTEENLLSKISSWTGKAERIYARKTTVVEVKTATGFFNENHFQGSSAASVTLVLKMNGEIVAGMSFGKPRFTDKYQWELIRFCSKKGTQVIGGASKLLSHFVKEHQPENIVSYSNLQWSGGGLYEALGFELSHLSEPNYIWMNGKRILPRYKTQKHKLYKLLGDKFNPELSEKENMQNAGYSRVFDCGNEVYVIQF